MKLQDEGKLSIKDKVFGEEGVLRNTYLDSLVRDTSYAHLTIEHLLRHQGGFYRDPLFSSKDVKLQMRLTEPPVADDFFKLMLPKALVFKPLSGAVGIIIGKTIGEGRVEKIKEYAYTTQLIFIVLGAITAAALLIARQPFVSLYDIGNEASKIAIQLISVLSLTIVGTSYQSACLIGLVKSGGDVSFILKNDSFFIFLVVIPLSITAARLGAPLWLIFLALKSDQILKCIPAAIKINRFRWIKKL